MVIQLDRTKTEFLTEAGMISFPKVFPGQAEDGAQPGSKKYGCEHITDKLSQQLIDAVTYVAQAHDPSNWQRHVFGPHGKLKKLEESTRDPNKYPYAVGKYFYSLNKTLSLNSLQMKNANLSDPTVRAEFDRKVNAAAPKVVRFANVSSPMDIARIEQINQERVAKGLTPHQESQYHAVLLPVQSHELWAGCKVIISGRAFWEPNKIKTVCLSLEQILLVAEGERLAGGEASPDATFGAFAPPADLAPKPADDPWAAVR